MIFTVPVVNIFISVIVSGLHINTKTASFSAKRSCFV